MLNGGVERRLAAILAADVVGYSCLMAADEAGTHARLKALRKEVVEPKIAEHRGRIVKLTGDGVLAEFPSVLDAVACAVEVQRGMAERNAEVAPEHQIAFRVGVNLGDVIFDEDDIYGDGVNVAARLEGFAEAGGVCISAKVHEEVKNKLGFGYQDLGPQSVKNIPEPVRAYRVLTEAGATGTAVGLSTAVARGKRPVAWKWPALAAMVAAVVIGAGSFGWLRPWESAGEMAGATLDTRRVAVLPFANISADVADEYFSDGMTEELISQLSKIGKLSVIARTSIMKYKGTDQDIAEIGRALQVGTILEGSVRKAGDQVRITAQLIDVQRQAHLWSEGYDRDLEDIFTIQSDIAENVAEALQITLLGNEREQIEKQQTTDLEAYNLYLKGRYAWARWTRQGTEDSVGYFERAIERDPNFALAYVGLADAYNQMPWFTDMQSNEAYAKSAEAAKKAIELDNTLAEAYNALAVKKINNGWDWDGAEDDLKKAISRNPSFATAYANYGQKILSPIRGKYDEALTLLRRAQELDPESISTNTRLGFVYLHARRWNEAIRQFEIVAEMSPESHFAHFGIGMSYAGKRMYDEAIAALQKSTDASGRNWESLSSLGWTFTVAGRRDEALGILDELRNKSEQQFVEPMAFTYVYAGLGDNQKALESLEKAYELRSASLMFLRTVLPLDSLRSEPRFEAIMEKIGLEPAAPN